MAQLTYNSITFNAIDIDRNGMVLCDKTINTTGELLSN